MRKFILAAVICSVMAQQAAAFGALLNEPVFDRDTERIIISGTTEKKSYVTVEVLGPGGAASEITDDDLTADSLIFMKQIQADSNGGYSISFPAKYGTGKYSVRVYSSAEDEYSENSGLFVFSRSDIDALTAKIAGIDNSGDMDIILEPDTVKILGIDVSRIKDMEPSRLDEFYVCLFNEKKESCPSNVSEIQTMIDRAYLLYTINNESSAEALKRIISENSDILQLDSSCSMNLYSDDKVYDDTRRNNMLSKLTEENYSTISEFKKSFGDKTLLYSLYGQSGYHIIETIIEESAVIKEYDLSAYNALKDKTTVLKSLNGCKKPFETVKELVAAIESRSDNGHSPSTGGNGGGGGGGSKTSGGGKTVMSVPAETPKPENDNPPAEKNKEFTDIKGFEWASEAIYSLREKGIISGRSETQFSPGDNITREEFMKLLIKASGAELGNQTIDFEDANRDEWYYSYIAAGVRMGIVKGKKNNKFGVGDFITREDMTVMTGRLIEYLGIDLETGENTFADFESISEYAKNHVTKLSKNKIINGVGENKFEPKLYLNRASAAKIIYETEKLINKK